MANLEDKKQELLGLAQIFVDKVVSSLSQSQPSSSSNNEETEVASRPGPPVGILNAQEKVQQNFRYA